MPLVRIMGLDFVAGAVIGEDDKVTRTAPKIKWARGLTTEELRAEIKQRGLRATYVRTLTLQEMKAKDPDDDASDDDGV